MDHELGKMNERILRVGIGTEVGEFLTSSLLFFFFLFPFSISFCVYGVEKGSC